MLIYIFSSIFFTTRLCKDNKNIILVSFIWSNDTNIDTEHDTDNDMSTPTIIWENIINVTKLCQGCLGVKYQQVSDTEHTSM